MRIEYERWIRDNVPSDCQGMCEHMSKKLAEEFPELTVVKGTADIVGPYGTEHTTPHWWCEDELGNVIDPTAEQFGAINEHNRIDGMVVGKCLECGTYVTEDMEFAPNFCCAIHSQAYINYLNSI